MIRRDQFHVHQTASSLPKACHSRAHALPLESLPHGARVIPTATSAYRCCARVRCPVAMREAVPEAHVVPLVTTPCGRWFAEHPTNEAVPFARWKYKPDDDPECFLSAPPKTLEPHALYARAHRRAK